MKEVCRPNWTKGKNKKTQKIWDSEARIRIPGPVFTNLENDEVVVDHVQIPQLINPISWNLFFLRSPDNILELPSMVSIFLIMLIRLLMGSLRDLCFQTHHPAKVPG